MQKYDVSQVKVLYCNLIDIECSNCEKSVYDNT